MSPELASKFQRQVRIDELPALYRQLGMALIQTGVPPSRASDLLEHEVLIRCSQCQITIVGKELSEVALIDLARQTDNKKIKRLALGYCTRGDCRALYAELSINSMPDIHWPTVWESAERDLRAGKTNAPLSEGSYLVDSILTRIFAAYGRREIIATTLILGVVFLLLWWFWIPPAYSRSSPEYGGAKVIIPLQP